MADQTVKNDAQAESMEKALAAYRRDKLQAVVDYLNSDEVKAVEAKFQEFVATKLPDELATAANVRIFAGNIQKSRDAAERDMAYLGAKVSGTPMPATPNGAGEPVVQV